MSIAVTDSFERTKERPLDSSLLVQTVSDLKSAKKPYNGQIAWVESTKRHYFYHSSHPANAVTGKWKILIEDTTTTPTEITGPGRPDRSETTSGKIGGNEANGTRYVSTDGAGVGAWVWLKTGGKWRVVTGDTGWVTVTRAINLLPGSVMKMRRLNDNVLVSIGNPSNWGLMGYKGKKTSGFQYRKTNTVDIIKPNGIPDGWVGTGATLPLYNDDGWEVNAIFYITGHSDARYADIRMIGKTTKVPDNEVNNLRFSQLSYVVDDREPWPYDLRL